MIKAIFFDLYNTLVHYEPPPEMWQSKACQEFGLKAQPHRFHQAFQAAGDFLRRENARFPISRRGQKERGRLWIGYEFTLLQSAGVKVNWKLASKILERVCQFDSRVAVYEDAPPTLSLLQSRELKLGLISNLDSSLEEFCRGLEIFSFFDFYLISCEVGLEKPHPGMFRLALERARVKPEEAFHVGDEYFSDVVGARRLGIKPLLLDREGLMRDCDGCERIRSLREILKLL